MSSIGTEAPSVHELCEVGERQEFNIVGKYLSKTENKESLNVNTSHVKFTTRPGQYKEHKSKFF